MIVDFEKIEEKEICYCHGGELSVFVKDILSGKSKVSLIRIPPGASIGSHCHFDNTEYDYAISGEGTAVINEITEFIEPGDIHICKQGSMHSILNTSEEDFIFLSIIS